MRKGGLEGGIPGTEIGIWAEGGRGGREGGRISTIPDRRKGGGDGFLSTLSGLATPELPDRDSWIMMNLEINTKKLGRVERRRNWKVHTKLVFF